MTRLNRGKRILACICAVALISALAACTDVGSAETSAGEVAATVSGSEQTMAAEESGAEENKDTDTGALENGTVPYTDNDTVTLGTLEAYDPANSVEVNAGEAIEGNAEEELQQERIAGGAVGEVVSENLEPLHGIVDPSEGDYTPVYGVDGQ